MEKIEIEKYQKHLMKLVKFIVQIVLLILAKINFIFQNLSLKEQGMNVNQK